MDEGTKDVNFYRQLWERLVDREFTSQKLADRLRADGGVDIENLSNGNVLDLIEGRFSGPWSEVAFTASELLASYSVPGGIHTPEQVVGWVFASFAFADSIKNDEADWEIQFNIFINGFLAVRDKLETEESIHIFQRVFHCSTY
ncbi:MAG: hypothetical protein ACREXX_09160 [Gammaproteobacteria bacterium]